MMMPNPRDACTGNCERASAKTNFPVAKSSGTPSAPPRVTASLSRAPRVAEQPQGSGPTAETTGAFFVLPRSERRSAWVGSAVFVFLRVAALNVVLRRGAGEFVSRPLGHPPPAKDNGFDSRAQGLSCLRILSLGLHFFPSSVAACHSDPDNGTLFRCSVVVAIEI